MCDTPESRGHFVNALADAKAAVRLGGLYEPSLAARSAYR